MIEEAAVMETNISLYKTAITPAVVRVAVTRLLSWLPTGTVSLLGDDVPALARALRQMGVNVTADREDSAATATVIVIEHAGASQMESAVQPLLAGLAGPICLVVLGEAAAHADRATWESLVIKAEWRKHPLNERVAPYGELDLVTGLLMMSFERVPAPALAVYPLKALEEERDLHTDMTREPGRRSDAHMTRYAQAAQFIRPGDRVIDVACGLGYGSYQLAHNSDAASFTGLDASDYAVEYANLNFAPASPTPMTFVVGDAQNLSGMADASADFAVSVETLEHLPEPDRLLAELHRVLSPQGRIYASVPNDWSDETGEDPNPFHFHVYDWPRLVAQFQRNGFVIERAWLQDAGGGQKRHLSARSMLEIDPAVGPIGDSEWLLVLARKASALEQPSLDPLAQARTLLADGRPEAALALLDSELDGTDPLRDARKQALAAVILTQQGKRSAALQRWQHVQASARQALPYAETEAAAAGLIHLATMQRAGRWHDRPGHAHLALRQHAGVLSDLLGIVDTMPGDSEDRAVVSGSGDGAEQINLGARDVRQLIEAKAWLDGKYHEHMQRIAELESHTAELELARDWLDRQYHALNAEIQRLNQARQPAPDDFS